MPMSSLSLSTLDLSFNQPKLPSCAHWNPDGITFTNRSTIGGDPIAIFITPDNTVYVASRGSSGIQMWPNGNSTSIRVFITSGSAPSDVFVTNDGDMYIDNGASKQSVDVWMLNGTSAIAAMHVSGCCFGVFVDIYRNLYCASQSNQQVVKRSLNEAINGTTVVAGNGTSGNSPNMLSGPRGIFVDTNLSLYVCDCYNGRIQRFSYGRSTGITVAGYGATGSPVLSLPTDVILDADGYLYIVEYGNHRIVASGPHGFRCIIACTRSSGSASNQLSNPHSLSFDREGNLFVIDTSNSRVQKFVLANHSCSKYFITRTDC